MAEKIRLVMMLRKQGITNGEVLSAIEKLKREDFVEADLSHCSYEDQALPIACGQTISQPSIVGIMTQALEVNAQCKVLEIGTGSGYQTAILAQLCRRVYTIERYKTLLQMALKRFQEYGYTNIVHRAGNGAKGWVEQAPFDRILVTAACPDIPEILLKQIKKDTGILVAPVGQEGHNQTLYKFSYFKGELINEALGIVRFVPLVTDSVDL